MSTEPSVRLEVDLKQGCQLNIEDEVFSFESAAKHVDTLIQAMNDRYRCPEKFFDLILSEKLSSNAGYFRFGPNAICYGRSCSGMQGRPLPARRSRRQALAKPASMLPRS